VLSCVRMRVSAAFTALLGLLLIGGCGTDASPDHQAEWRDVLRHKRDAVAPDAPAERKQVYADSVRAFVEKHPNHTRAREVWQRLQLEFANDLARVGRYQDAIRFYRAVLTHHPENDEARRGLAAAADRLAITRDKLEVLRKGMSHREVASVLGRPVPGWVVKHRRAGITYEAWYYRTRTGELAAVYFRDGEVLAAEESSNAQLGRLGS
jgi:hypothetical protein